MITKITKLYQRQQKLRQRLKKLRKRKLKHWRRNNPLIYYFSHILIGLTLCMLFVIFTCKGGLVAWLLGTDNKKETIQFIAYGMGGVVAAIVATAISRRADAQMQNNELIEKGHDNERFQHMTANLGHKKVTVRIATFYRFYYLAAKNKGGNPQKLREDIFEMLCSYLRAMPDNASDLEEKDKNEYLKERQTLFDILFKDKFKSNNNGLMPDDFPADLQKINLDKMNLSGANLSGANLSEAKLSNAHLSFANLSKAHLSGANFSGTYLSFTNLSDAKLLAANFSGSNISYANLLNAEIIGTNFTRANLSNANLSGAILWDTNLLDANLSYATLRGTRLNDMDLQNVNSVEKTDFCEATVKDEPISLEHIPNDKGEYYANWNPPPEKEEN